MRWNYVSPIHPLMRINTCRKETVLPFDLEERDTEKETLVTSKNPPLPMISDVTLCPSSEKGHLHINAGLATNTASG